MGKENPKCSLGKSQDYKAPSLGSTETGSTAFSEVLRDLWKNVKLRMRIKAELHRLCSLPVPSSTGLVVLNSKCTLEIPEELSKNSKASVSPSQAT